MKVPKKTVKSTKAEKSEKLINSAPTLFSRKDLVVRELAAGGQLTIPVFHFPGTHPHKAPSVYLQANVHGAEVQGNAVLYELMKYLCEHPPQGSMTIVPQANPYGANQKSGEYTAGRFDPATGNNWNRSYWKATCKDESDRRDPFQINLKKFCKLHSLHSLSKSKESWAQTKNHFKKSLKESIEGKLKQAQDQHSIEASLKLCLILQRLASQADYVLDLHTGPLSTQYVYAPEYACQAAKELRIPNILLVPQVFEGAMDEASFIPWWELHEMMEGRNSLDFEAYTLEYGSQEQIRLQEAQQSCRNLLNYFFTKGVLSKAHHQQARDQSPSLQYYAGRVKDYKGIFTKQAGLVEFEFAPGQMVDQGDLLCQILNFQQFHRPADFKKGLSKIFAPEKAILINCTPAATVHEGTELCRLMTNFWPL